MAFKPLDAGGVAALKQLLDIEVAFARIEAAIAKYPRAAMFQLARDGHDSLWEQLVSCVLSIRTYDETSLPAALRLFARARTPQELLRLSVEEIDALISPVTYHEAKAPQLQAMAQRIVDEYNGELPADREVLLSFHGIGPKCAALSLGIACGQAWVSVDVHVHRVVNRWGLVATKTPEATAQKLETLVAPQLHVDVNRLLMPFGKHICTDKLPRCSTCPVLEMCQQVGVKSHK